MTAAEYFKGLRNLAAVIEGHDIEEASYMEAERAELDVLEAADKWATALAEPDWSSLEGELLEAVKRWREAVGIVVD